MGEECCSRAPPVKEPGNYATVQGGTSKETVAPSKIDEKELERLAVEAILEEAKRGKSRAEQVGAIGWSKSELPKANKRFLSSTLANVASSNSRKKSRLDDGHWHRDREETGRSDRTRREHYHHRSRRSRSREDRER